MQLFRFGLLRYDPALEPTFTPLRKLRLLGKLRQNIALAKRLLYDVDSGKGATTEKTQSLLDMAATMKLCFRSPAFH